VWLTGTVQAVSVGVSDLAEPVALAEVIYRAKGAQYEKSSEMSVVASPTIDSALQVRRLLLNVVLHD
jgi:hypothetical protein